MAISACLLPFAFLLRRKIRDQRPKIKDSPPAHNLRLGPASPPVPAPDAAPDPPAAPRPDSSAILRLRSRCRYCGRPGLTGGSEGLQKVKIIVITIIAFIRIASMIEEVGKGGGGGKGKSKGKNEFASLSKSQQFRKARVRETRGIDCYICIFIL